MSLYFFKQKTAYEMRISDWSSDVCSSDHADGFDAGIEGASLLCGIDAGFDKTEIFVKDCILDRDRQSKNAVKPPLDGREFFDQLAFIFKAQAGAVTEITEGDAGQFAAMQQSIPRSEEHTSELQSLMRISYAVFCLKKKT